MMQTIRGRISWQGIFTPSDFRGSRNDNLQNKIIRYIGNYIAFLKRQLTAIIHISIMSLLTRTGFVLSVYNCGKKILESAK